MQNKNSYILWDLCISNISVKVHYPSDLGSSPAKKLWKIYIMWHHSRNLLEAMTVLLVQQNSHALELKLSKVHGTTEDGLFIFVTLILKNYAINLVISLISMPFKKSEHLSLDCKC
jgi:hypothetical protein